MKPHEFHPDTEIEMLAQADYLESRDIGVGIRFLMAVDRAIQRLKYDPSARPKAIGDVRRQPVEGFLDVGEIAGRVATEIHGVADR